MAARQSARARGCGCRRHYGARLRLLPAVDSLGVRDDTKLALAEAASRRRSIFSNSIPAAGVIPGDIRESCEEDERRIPRTALTAECVASARIMSRYELLLDALVTTYAGDHYGAGSAPASRDVMALVPRPRPYRVDEKANAGFIDVALRGHHVVYVLNDQRKIPPAPGMVARTSSPS